MASEQYKECLRTDCPLFMKSIPEFLDAKGLPVGHFVVDDEEKLMRAGVPCVSPNSLARKQAEEKILFRKKMGSFSAQLKA